MRKDLKNMIAAKNNRFNLPISNVAVCIIGCWRTGDVLIDYIRDFFLVNPNINVHFYLYLKSFDTMTGDENSVPDHDPEALEKRIKRSLGNHLIDLRIITHSEPLSSIYLPVFSNITEVVHMKSMEEKRRGIVYDLVWIMRPDLIMYPSNYFEKFLKYFNQSHQNSRRFEVPHGREIYMYPLMGKDTSSIVPEYQDTVMCGSSVAVDLLANSMLTHIGETLDYKDLEFIDLTDAKGRLHEGLYYATEKYDIIRTSFPELQYNINRSHIPLGMTIMRKDDPWAERGYFNIKDLNERFDL